MCLFSCHFIPGTNPGWNSFLAPTWLNLGPDPKLDWMQLYPTLYDCLPALLTFQYSDVVFSWPYLLFSILFSLVIKDFRCMINLVILENTSNTQHLLMFLTSFLVWLIILNLLQGLGKRLQFHILLPSHSQLLYFSIANASIYVYGLGRFCFMELQ